MKSEDYIKILDENLQLSVQKLDQWFTFLQDNNPKHSFKLVSAWLQKKISFAIAFNESWLES